MHAVYALYRKDKFSSWIFAWDVIELSLNSAPPLAFHVQCNFCNSSQTNCKWSRYKLDGTHFCVTAEKTVLHYVDLVKMFWLKCFPFTHTSQFYSQQIRLLFFCCLSRSNFHHFTVCVLFTRKIMASSFNGMEHSIHLRIECKMPFHFKRNETNLLEFSYRLCVAYISDIDIWTKRYRTEYIRNAPMKWNLAYLVDRMLSY